MSGSRRRSADPDLIARYATIASTQDDLVLAIAGRVGVLADRARAADPIAAERLADLAGELRRLVAAERQLTSWALRFAARVRRADAGTMGRRFARGREMLQAELIATGSAGRRAAIRRLLAPDPVTHRPRRFMDVRPGGDGEITEVIGNVATADVVIVLVPGCATYFDNFDHTVSRRMRRMYAQASGHGRAVAVVGWLGYNPPNIDQISVEHLALMTLGFVDRQAVSSLGAMAQVASENTARRAAPDLDRFLARLPLRPDQQVTLVGHSYGSTVVGDALLDRHAPSDRLDPLGRPLIDSVVVVGSPGTSVSNVREFHRPHTRFYEETASYDVVANLGRFGAAPEHRSTGYTALRTSGTGHSAYFDIGSVGLANIAAVSLGRPVTTVPDTTRRQEEQSAVEVAVRKELASFESSLKAKLDLLREPYVQFRCAVTGCRSGAPMLR